MQRKRQDSDIRGKYIETGSGFLNALNFKTFLIHYANMKGSLPDVNQLYLIDIFDHNSSAIGK